MSKNQNDKEIEVDLKEPSSKNEENTKLIHTFGCGFGTITLLISISYSESANAGSAVFGPCGVHYT